MKSDIQIHLYGSLRNMRKKHDEFTIRTGNVQYCPRADFLGRFSRTRL